MAGAAEAEAYRSPAQSGLHGYRRSVLRKCLLLGAGCLVVALATVSASAFGAVRIPVGQVFERLLSGLLGGVAAQGLDYKIIWEIRLPRAVMAVVAGMGLAVSGVAMQSVLRNPLASPFTVGVSSAAGFGAALAVVLNISVLGWERGALAANAFVFALSAVLLMFLLARSRRGGPVMMVLAGIAVMYLFSALTTLLQFLGTESQLAQVVYWLFGSLAESTWGKIGFAGAALAVATPVLMASAWDLNVMVAGDDVAASLGIPTQKIRLVGIVASAFLTASVICVTGVIGFVCLVAPHMARLVFGSDHRFLFPGAAAFGALVLLVADTIGRTVVSPMEIPVGIVTSFVGVPLFLYLLLTAKKTNE